MSDTFGSLILPAPAPEDGAAIADPLLDVLLGFFAACMTDQLASAWAVRCPGVPIVRRTFAVNPSETGISANTHPALYGWRASFGVTKRAASDWYLRASTFSFLWVPEEAADERFRIRMPIINGIDSALSDALESVGRTPSWKVVGDDDPRAEDEGSSLWKHTRLHEIHVASTQWGTLTVETKNKEMSPFLRAVAVNVDVVERKLRDNALHADADYGITGRPMSDEEGAPAPLISLVDPSRPAPSEWLPILELEFLPAD